MNITMNIITEALLNREKYIQRGVDLNTKRYGVRYLVTTDGDIFYWDSKIVSFDFENKEIMISTCGYPSRTTLRVINVALEAHRVNCKLYNPIIVNMSAGDLYISHNINKTKWDGEQIILF